MSGFDEYEFQKEVIQRLTVIETSLTNYRETRTDLYEMREQFNLLKTHVNDMDSIIYANRNNLIEFKDNLNDLGMIIRDLKEDVQEIQESKNDKKANRKWAIKHTVQIVITTLVGALLSALLLRFGL